MPLRALHRNRAAATGGRRSGRRSGPGQSLVELTLALPMLLLIMLGTIDLGRMFFDYVQMRNGAREGAAYGARFPTQTSEVVLRVQRHGIPSGANIQTSCSGNCTTVNGTGTYTVTVSRTFTPVTTSFLSGFFGLGPVNLRTAASMRVMT